MNTKHLLMILVGVALVAVFLLGRFTGHGTTVNVNTPPTCTGTALEQSVCRAGG